MFQVSFRVVGVLCVAAMMIPFLGAATCAQSLPPHFTTPGGPSSLSRMLIPPYLAGASGGVLRESDFIPLSSGMLGGILPRIPNLELGFLYNVGSRLRSGRAYADYLLPLSLDGNSVLFGEAHGEFQDFWKSPQVSTPSGPGLVVTRSTSERRTDLSFGGGYRRLLGNRTFLGVNAFYDTTRLFQKWYSSAGVGLEMVALSAGSGAIDVNFNWYGNLINRSELVNAFRNRAGSWDIGAGISQPLFNQALDLRLNAAGYDFNVGTAVYGWRGGAEVTTRNGVLTLKYEHGHDRINGSYNTIGGFVNVGFSLESVLRGESPFTMPEPVFASPRNLRRLLSRKVQRNWHQPTAVVLSRSCPRGSPGPRPPGCANPLTPQGPIFPGIDFSNLTGVFIPFSSGLCYDNSYFVAAASILIDVSNTLTSGTGTIDVFWASSASDVASTPFFSFNGSTTGNDQPAPHSAGFAPAGPIRGVWISTTGTSTWTLFLDNIRVQP